MWLRMSSSTPPQLGPSPCQVQAPAMLKKVQPHTLGRNAARVSSSRRMLVWEMNWSGGFKWDWDWRFV